MAERDATDWQEEATRWMKRATAFQAMLLGRDGALLSAEDADRAWTVLDELLANTGLATNPDRQGRHPAVHGTDEPELQHMGICRYALQPCTCPREHLIAEAARLQVFIERDRHLVATTSDAMARLYDTVREFVELNDQLQTTDVTTDRYGHLELREAELMAELHRLTGLDD